MITIRRIFAAAFVAVFAAASAVAAGPAPEAQAAAYLEQLWRSSGTPAISIAVASKGRIVYSAGVGFADLENLVPENGSTVYNIGSVSKVITAVAVMQLVEQRKLALDDPIQKYVPAFPEKSPIPITIRHLMTHTSGIRHYRGTDFPNSEDNENTRPSSWEKVSRSSRMIRCCSAPVSITSTPRMPLTFFREWSRGPAVCHSRTTSGATSGGPVRRRPSAQLLLQRSDVQLCERRNDLDG